MTRDTSLALADRREARPVVLAVDDSQTNLALLESALTGECDVRCALSGATGFSLAAEIRPDIILLDIMMPDIDGYEVCERLKSDERTSNIPVVFLSALGEVCEQARGLELGAIDYIVRPVIPDLLRLRVRNHLQLEQQTLHLEELIAQRTTEVMRAHDATIAGMALLAEHRDASTGAHIRRTALYVWLLCQWLAPMMPDTLTPEFIELICQSSQLHDIGKVGIPDALLRKPGPLTADERRLMETHTLIGADVISRTERLLGGVSFLRVARDIAESHHERADGSGYPHGLAGDDIPLAARIVAIADVYDALVSNRPYARALTHEEAVTVILEGDGRTSPTHFDPVVLAAFRSTEQSLGRVAAGCRDADEKAVCGD